MDAEWFKNELECKTKHASSPCLATTWSDGENGGWFRQTDEESGFWGHYFVPYIDKVTSHEATITPVMISDYLNKNKPTDDVEVRTGAWNVGTTSGYDFSQWEGSETQKKAMKEVWEISTKFHQLKKQTIKVKKGNSAKAEALLKQAEDWLLRAETSCYFFWGDAWIPKVYENTAQARHLLTEAEHLFH
jgi:hypothetical protein